MMMPGDMSLHPTARRSKHCEHCVLTGIVVYKKFTSEKYIPVFGLNSNTTQHQVAAPSSFCLTSCPLTTSINHLLGLSLGLLPDIYNWATSQSSQALFLVLPSIKLKFCTSQHHQVCLSVCFQKTHLLCSTISCCCLVIGRHLRTTPRRFSNITTSFSDVFVLFTILNSRVILHTIFLCCLARLPPTTNFQSYSFFVRGDIQTQ